LAAPDKAEAEHLGALSHPQYIISISQIRLWRRNLLGVCVLGA